MNSNIAWLTTRASKSKQLIHLVFVTKYRRPVLTEKMLRRCEAIFEEQCRKQNALLHEFNGENDHVHILVQIPPTISLSLLVKSLKGNASLQLRKQFWPEIQSHRAVGSYSLFSQQMNAVGLGFPQRRALSDHCLSAFALRGRPDVYWPGC
jgi:REP element-mobilizing transposase RayT